MRNYVKPGETMPIVAGANLASGQAVIVGTLLAIACGAIANGANGEARIEGVVILPKLSGANIAQGAVLTWDTSASQVIIADAAVGDLENFGVAYAAAGASTTTVRVKLTPGTGRVKAS